VRGRRREEAKESEQRLPGGKMNHFAVVGLYEWNPVEPARKCDVLHNATPHQYIDKKTYDYVPGAL
jgi:hypothetical protein